MKLTKITFIPCFAGGGAKGGYLPGYSEKYVAKHEQYIERSTRKTFFSKKKGVIGMLSTKAMGDQNGLCPIEEVVSFSSVDPGAIIKHGCNEKGLSPSIEQGLDCMGNKVDIVTKGNSGSSVHCKTDGGGSMTMGVDAFSPEFFSYPRKFPPFCTDSAQMANKEVQMNFKAMQNSDDLVMRDLEYLLHDEILKRGKGNTSMSDEVIFGEDVGLTGGRFPFLPKYSANHEFLKTIQDIVMQDPNNEGKKFYFKASSLQIDRAIQDHQDDFKISRESGDKIQDPYRTGENIYLYDGIYYIREDRADSAGAVEMANGTYEIVRPREFVHQAGNVFGLTTRPNYEKSINECTIECGGRRFPRVEIGCWYLEESIYFVPFKADLGGVQTSGDEKIKNQTYNTIGDFKTYWVTPHEVEVPEGCDNSRNQWQQMGLMTKFGLFSRPDIKDFGFVLLAPTKRCINGRSSCNDKDKPVNPDITSVGFDHSGNISSKGCGGETAPVIYGDTGTPLSSTPTPDNPNPTGVDEEVGTVGFVGSLLSFCECSDSVAKVCIERVNGCMGAVKVEVNTLDGSAVNGTNYTEVTQTIEWLDGEMGDRCLDIPLIEAGITDPVTFDICITLADGTKVTNTVTINPCGEEGEACPSCTSCN